MTKAKQKAMLRAQVVRLSASDKPNQGWVQGEGVFSFINRSRRARTDHCGCLTMIRAYGLEVESQQLVSADLKAIVAEIAADERIPKDAAEITVGKLPVFLEYWERLIDLGVEPKAVPE